MYMYCTVLAAELAVKYYTHSSLVPSLFRLNPLPTNDAYMRHELP